MSLFWRHFLVAGIWIVAAIVIQNVILSQLPLPGATPDLLLVLVVGWGMTKGSLEGVIVGFVAGLMLDIIPPAVGTVGVWPLILAVVGYFVGLAADDGQRSAITPLVIVALASVASMGAYLSMSILLGTSPMTSASEIIGQLFTQGLYAVALALAVLPALSLSIRRIEPTSPRW